MSEVLFIMFMTLLHQTCELERDYCELERDHCDGIFDYRVVLKPVNSNIELILTSITELISLSDCLDYFEIKIKEQSYYR